MKGTCFLNFITSFLLLVSMAYSAMEVTNITADQTALLALKAHLTDPHNVLANNWSTTASVCSWIGVSCGAPRYRVSGLNLSHMSLSGYIPSEIGNLSFLAFLSIRNNTFQGSLPNELANLLHLEYLDFGFNSFTGDIPIDIFNHLPKLRGIYFSRNRLSGSIPRTIGNCTMIEEINLSENNLTGVLPPELGGLSNLKTLRIDDNALIGNVPSALFNISAIEVIGMYANLLSGSLPPTMGLFMPNLRELRLGGNELEGTIPSSISNASTLAVVDLSSNSFTGLIPGTLGNLRQLQVLNLANNHLTSESSTPQLSIFSALENCKNLRRIYLSVNPLNTTLPISIGNLSSSLEQFWADECNLKGNIPKTIGNLSSLIALSLANNELTSVVPTATERLTNLQLLNLQGILVLNLSSNFLSGSLPLVFRQLMVAVEIDLSRNQLSGQIPNSTWDLKNLAYLSLATNRLQGPIPGSLSFAVSLEFLDLSLNSLSGLIPKSLETLLHLKYFNVSFNVLQGEIPSEGPFRKFSAQSYVMNNGLCGSPRLHVPPCKTYALRGSTVTLVFLLELILPLIAATMAALFIFIWLRCPNKNVRPNLVNTRFTYRDLEQATDRFGEGNLLGRGSFGSVYKGTLRDGKIVAIKVFDAENEVCCRSFEVEREVMCNACHPNIITIFCSSNAVNFKALVMEYMVNGSLDKWLYTHNYSLDILQRLDIMINTASALEYLHSGCSRIIIHGDLKPSNILLDEDMISRLSDFSISQFLKRDGQQNSSGPSLFLGTIGYVAPEYGIHGIVSTETDVYSFGILLMETFTGKKPTDEMFGGEMSLRSWIMETLPSEIERVVDPCLLQNEEEYFHAKTTCSSDIMRLALMCTSESPVERLNMKVVVDTLDEIKRLFIWNISGDNPGESNLEELDPNRIRNNMKKFVKWRRETLLPNLEWRLPDYQYETNS